MIAMSTVTQEKPKPFSVQLDPSLHRQLAERAASEDRSLGYVTRKALRTYLGARDNRPIDGRAAHTGTAARY
jgi:predicted transcriptional regulator